MIDPDGVGWRALCATLAHAGPRINGAPDLREILPYADLGPLSAKLLQNGTLKTPGIPTLLADD